MYAANSTAHSTGMLAADRAILLPQLSDPAYIELLLRVCKTYEIDAIVPLFDLELPLLAHAKEHFRTHGVQVLVSSPSVVETCNDKWNTRVFLSDNGFDTPAAALGLDAALAALRAKQLHFPLIVKPRRGMGSIGIWEAEDEIELRAFCRKARIAIDRSYLALTRTGVCEADVLVQEKVDGAEYGLDVINDLEGNHVTTFVKRKLAMRAGETDVARTEDTPMLRDLGRRLGERLRHTGILDVDIIVSGGRAYVLELNARFGGHYPFAHLAGADLPGAILAWLEKRSPDPRCFEMAYDVTGYKALSIVSGRSDIVEFRAGQAER